MWIRLNRVSLLQLILMICSSFSFQTGTCTLTSSTWTHRPSTAGGYYKWYSFDSGFFFLTIKAIFLWSYKVPYIYILIFNCQNNLKTFIQGNRANKNNWYIKYTRFSFQNIGYFFSWFWLIINESNTRYSLCLLE